VSHLGLTSQFSGQRSMRTEATTFNHKAETDAPEGMQAAQVIGEPIDEEMAIRLSSEIRRILTPIIERSAARRDAAAPSAIRDRLTGAAA